MLSRVPILWKFPRPESTGRSSGPSISPVLSARRVRVRTRELIDGRRSFLGSLLEVSPEKIAVSQDGTRWEIPFSLIEKSNYEHDWSA